MKKTKINQDIALVISLVLCGAFAACSSFGGGSGGSTGSSSDCFDRVAAEMSAREGSKVVTRSDVDRYYSELRSRCS